MLLGGAVAMLTASAAWSREAVAGREIVNVATVTFTVEGRPGSANSNGARNRIQEVLGVTAGPGAPGPTPAADGERARALPFRLTNAGNGREAFALTLQPGPEDSAFAPDCPGLAIDTDGDGVHGAGDQAYAPGAEPMLAPGASVLVFALCDIPETVTDGQVATVRLTASAVTGSGEAGTQFEGRGDEGVDAIVGATTAATGAEAALVVQLGRPELVKAYTVQDRGGTARVIPGAVVTYTLTARLAGRGLARDVRIVDPVPAGASYVPESIRLDGQAISDSRDDDAGRFTGEGVEVALGTLEPTRERLVSFQVRIN
jgi:uncharacterized repeat protein (TIGR01451 family)